MSRVIVTSTYRYKRPPRKRKAVALEVPAIVDRTRITKAGKHDTLADDAKPAKPTKSPTARNLPAIVTARRPKGGASIPGLLPDTPEAHRRRGDAADALWRELVRRVRKE